MPPHYREVLALRYKKSWPLTRIASRMGVGVGNVKIRLYRARKRLAREIMDDEGFFKPAV